MNSGVSAIVGDVLELVELELLAKDGPGAVSQCGHDCRCVNVCGNGGRSAQCNSVPATRGHGTVRLRAVLVDPHTERHVRVDHEIENGTT